MNIFAVLLALFGVSVAQKEVIFSILEEPVSGFVIGNVATEAGLVTKYGPAEFSTLSFQLISGQNQGFVIQSSGKDKGTLKAIERIDRESICPDIDPCYISLDVAVQPELKEIIKVKILLKDRNDNRPQFPHTNVTIFVRESAPVGSKHSVPAARDPDTTPNSVKSYQIRSNDGFFQMSPIETPERVTEVFLELLKPLDRETKASHDVTITARDGGNPAKIGVMNVRVIVTDFNDHRPRFKQSKYDVEIPENTLPQTTIKTVTATDLDEGENARVSYRITRSSPIGGKSLFGIREETGEIFVKRKLNFKTGSSYTLTITAQDNGDEQKLKSTATVKITLTDFNDHAPKITIKTLTDAIFPHVSENGKKGDFVAYTSVEDSDSGMGGEFECSLKDERNFKLNKLSESGFRVVTNRVFDYEKEKVLNLTVTCRDFGEPSLSSVKSVPVYIVDKNDHAPVFNRSEYTVAIDENQAPGTFVFRIWATDGDGGPNAEIEYSLGEDANGEFKINQRLGIISTNKRLDADPKDENDKSSKDKVFTVFAHDKGKPSKSANATVTVRLNDVNDNAPKFKQSIYRFNVSENDKRSRVLGEVIATDPDKTKSRITYYLGIRSEGREKFAVTSTDGVGIVRSLRPLDREDKEKYTLWVVAREARAPFHNTSVKVEVKVLDKNDNPPEVMFPTTYNNTIHISYLTPAGRKIGQVKATDADSGRNGRLNFQIFQGNERKLFEMDNRNGEVVVVKRLQPSDKKEYKLVIIIRDDGLGKPKPVFRNLIIKVSDPEGLADRFGGQLGDRTSLMIIIILAAVSATVSIFIIVIIVIIRKRYNSDMYYDRDSKSTDDNFTPYHPTDCEMQKHSRPPIIVRTDCDSMGSSETNKSAGSGNATVPLIRRPLELNNKPTDTQYASAQRIGGRLQRFQPAAPGFTKPQSPPYYTTDHQRAFGFGLNNLDGNNETASNCDSGKGTSEEDLRRIREENATMNQGSGGPDCSYSNRTMSTFQRRPTRPPQSGQTSSLQALNQDVVENNNFRTNSESPGSPQEFPEADSNNKGLQILPNVMDIKGETVSVNSTSLERNGKSRLEQYTVV